MKIIKHPEADSILIEAKIDTTRAYALENIARCVSAANRRESLERRPHQGLRAANGHLTTWRVVPIAPAGRAGRYSGR